MKNNKHIFAQHISEVGVKNPALEQNLNVINEMADGGTIYNFDIGDTGKYVTKSGVINIQITNVTEKGWVIFKDDEGNRKDAKIDVFNSKFIPSRTKTLITTPITKLDSPMLEVDAIYNVKDFDWEIDDDREYYEKYSTFKVFKIGKNSKSYLIESPDYTGTTYSVIGFDEIVAKIPAKLKPVQTNSSNYLLEKGKTYNFSDYDFLYDDLNDYFKNGNYDKFTVYDIIGRPGGRPGDTMYFEIEKENYTRDTRYWTVNMRNVKLKQGSIGTPVSATPSIQNTNKLELGKTYNVADFDIDRDTLNTYFKGNKIEKFTVYKISNDSIYEIERENYTEDEEYWKVDFDDIKPKQGLNPIPVSSNQSILNPQILEVGKTYNVADFIFQHDSLNNYFRREGIDKFTIYSINNGYYGIERVNYTDDTAYYTLEFKDVIAKQGLNPIPITTTSTTIGNNGIFIGAKGQYETRTGLIYIEITNITDKGWVIYKDVKGERKDAKIDAFTKKFRPSNQTIITDEPVIANTQTNPKTTLAIGSTIIVDDYVFTHNNISSYLEKNKILTLTLFKIIKNRYQFIDVKGKTYDVDIDAIFPKPKFSDGEEISLSKYQILIPVESKYFKKIGVDEVIITEENDYWWNIKAKNRPFNTNVPKNKIIPIDLIPKFDYKIGELIPVDAISDTEQDKQDIISSGFSEVQVVGFMPFPYSNGFCYEVIAGTNEPYYYYLINTDSIEPKQNATPTPSGAQTQDVDSVNLQPANQTQSKPKPQKIDFTSAKENFVQNNIIGENTIFTPKFVLLESLMELNELSKDKEEDLSSDLESIINNIDSFVIDQCAITPNDSSCGQIPQNIQPITTTKSKSKKSKPMPNMDINSIMNNPNLPDDIRNMIARGLESGMNTMNF